MSELTRQDYKQYIIDYGLDPDDFVFLEDHDEDHCPDDDYVLALINDAYSPDDGLHFKCRMEILRPCWYEFSLDGWVGPVRYVIAYTSLKNVKDKK